MATLVYRVFIVGLGLLALAGQAVQLDTLFWRALGVGGGWSGGYHPAFASVLAMDGILTALMVLVALVLAFHPAATRSSRPLGLTIAVWGYLLAYPGLILLLRPADPESVPALLFQTHFLMVEMLGLGALLRFSALFPRELTPSDLQDPDTLASGLGLLQRCRAWLLGSSSPWIAAGLTTVVALAINAFLGNPPPEAALTVLVDAVRFVALSVVVLNLRRAYLLSEAPEREAARWLGVGFALLVGSLAVLMGGNVLSTVTGWRLSFLNWRPLVLDLGLLGLVWGTAMGSFYRGPLRSGPVGRRVVTFSFLAMAVLLLAAGLETLFSDVLLARLALPRGVGTLVAGLALGMLYTRFARPLARVLEESWKDGGPARTG